jgi:hypothetical protein
MQEAKEAEKDKDNEPEPNDKVPENNKEKDDPKDQKKKCEFCDRNNIEDGKKITIEGKGEYQVCQPCYKLYGDKGDKDDKKQDDNNRERERERDKLAPFVARIQF